MQLVQFWQDESGQITIDWTVPTAALIGIGLVASAEVATGVTNVTDQYSGIQTGEGVMAMFAGRDTPDNGGGG